MKTRRMRPSAPRARGTSLIEVLVTVVIIVVGLLGMAGLQVRSQTLELESYQRGQALILLQDMVDRMNGNAANAASYVTTSVGTGTTDNANCSSLGTRAAVDLCEWSKALKGSSEVVGGVSKGAMINGRGCVTAVTAGVSYRVAVAWQGMSQTVTPVSTCGANSYDSEASRRAVTAIVQVPDLGTL